MGNLSNKLLRHLPHHVGGGHGNNTDSTDMPLWLLVVLEYCDWPVRFRVAMLSRQWRSNTNTLAFYRFLCQRLAADHGLYVPLTLPARMDWKALFAQLYPLRDLWGLDEHPASKEEAQRCRKETSKIQVFARFRPALLSEEQEEEEGVCAGVVLPLHQRLAMIRLNHKLRKHQSALKILTEQGGWFQAKWQSLSLSEEKGHDEEEEEENGSLANKENNRSFYADMNKHQRAIPEKLKQRLRGQQQDQEDAKMVSKIVSCDGLFGRVVMMTPDTGLREFSYDGVLTANISQKVAYDTCVKPLVIDLLNGYNATALVYGQTGSGKTYSMFGRDELTDRKAESRGVIPRACEEILSAISQRQHNNGIITTLKVSYVEIYGDQVTDLLKYGARCGHSKVAAQRYVLNGAAEYVVDDMEGIYDLLTRGDAQKRRAATAMNDRSTRAHSLFIVTLEQTHPTSVTTIRSRLFLADLGGSEQVKKSLVEAGGAREGAENNFSVGFELGQRMREAVYINLGLLALKKCVGALNNGSPYVPYQDSKLTMLLSEGLGGNSKTSIIICNNLNPRHAQETLATLRFGERCAKIELSARNNATMLASVIANLDHDIAALEAAILKKERWVVQERRREDVLAEEGTLEKASGATEVMKVSIVTGAEAERKELVRLLRQRTALLGSTTQSDEEEEMDSNLAGEKKKKVLGFGKEYAEMYGLGSKFDEKVEEGEDNSRFQAGAKLEELPSVLRARKGAKSWAMGEPVAQSEEEVKKEAAKANRKRSKLAYSGISA